MVKIERLTGVQILAKKQIDWWVKFGLVVGGMKMGWSKLQTSYERLEPSIKLSQ